MHFTNALTVALASVACVYAMPRLYLKRGDGPGTPYQCTPAGSGAQRKQQLTSAGATAQDLAITIEETSCKMSGTSYPLGDIYPNGTAKTGDAANFGLFKNNWAMIRQYCTQFKGKQATDWMMGKTLNTDDKGAITCQHEMIQALGNDQFYTGQRGSGGSAGGQDYGNAVNFVLNYLNQGHLTDDWVTSYQLHNV